MEQEQFFMGVSRSLYYATTYLIGHEDRIDFERVLRDVLSYFYTDLLTNINAQSQGSFVGIIRRLTEKYSKPLLESTYKFFSLISTFVKLSKVVVSGSRSEGFDFNSSDYDFMLVIEKLFTGSSNNELQLLIEDDFDYPGFVKIKLPSGLAFPWMLICERHDGGTYLASSKLAEYFRQMLESMKVMSTPHGPCLSIDLDSQEDNDFAFVIKQETWPTLARGCIHRLARRGWPQKEVLLEILSNGCLYVPIGFPKSPHVGLQWRMSFSIAENLLVRSMNHTQFLSYALLKLTLKEVIDTDITVKDLLCSYFLKTAVFWEIASSRKIWDPSNLLHCYWKCFRRILQWVDTGYCPNFFVPENNMFRSKVNNGNNRRMLLDCLVKLYRSGFNVFKRIPSVSSEIDFSGENPTRQSIRDPLRHEKVAIMIHLVNMLLPVDIMKSRFFDNNCVDMIRRHSRQTHCEYSTALYTLLVLGTINEACFVMLSSLGQSGNRNYSKEKMIIHLLKLSSPYCVRGSLYLAYHLFIRMRYEDAIRVLHKVLTKLRDPNTIYRWEYYIKYDVRTAFREYRKIGGNLLPIAHGMRKHIAAEICLNYKTILLKLTGERNDMVDDNIEALSPFVFSHFLMFLCQLQIGSKMGAKKSLRDLERDQNYLEVFTESTKNLSKEILKICKKMYLRHISFSKRS